MAVKTSKSDAEPVDPGAAIQMGNGPLPGGEVVGVCWHREQVIDPLQRKMWVDAVQNAVINGKSLTLEIEDGFIFIPPSVLAESVVTIHGVKPQEETK